MLRSRPFGQLRRLCPAAAADAKAASLLRPPAKGVVAPPPPTVQAWAKLVVK